MAARRPEWSPSRSATRTTPRRRSATARSTPSSRQSTRRSSRCSAGIPHGADGARQTYRVVVLPGDGVGPDVVHAARQVLDAVAGNHGFDFEWTDIIAGGAAIDAYGVAIRPEDITLAGEADAVLLGAVGGPRWDDPDAAIRPEQALFALRGNLELFANLRPVRVHPSLVPSSPLRPELL